MRNRSSFVFTIVLYTFIVFGGGYWMGKTGWPLLQIGLPVAVLPPEATEESFEPFWEAWNLINSRFYDRPLDTERLVEGAIEGMLATLDDPYTRYLSPEVEAEARNAMEGELQGIGVQVEYIDEQITVVAPFAGSPAEAAGLEPGDILLEVDGVDLTDLDLGEAGDLIRGPAGTTVHLVVGRDGERFEVDITRDVIRVPSVEGEIIENNIAYIRLSRFGNRTYEELEETLEMLMAREPAGLVLDLRNNPGGGLSTAVDIADQFLDEGIVLVEEFGGGREQIHESDNRGLAEEIPMVVLINEGSASASEVLAGALRERERATLIGQPSFGKGTVQLWYDLSNGGGIRITTARWLTPGRTWIHETGLTPDLAILLPAAEDPFSDTQLEAAIQYLTEGMVGDAQVEPDA